MASPTAPINTDWSTPFHQTTNRKAGSGPSYGVLICIKQVRVAEHDTMRVVQFTRLAHSPSMNLMGPASQFRERREKKRAALCAGLSEGARAGYQA